MTTDANDFETRVNSVVSAMVQGADETWTIPEEVASTASPEVLYAAKLAKRQRDTQSAYTKASQKAKSLEAINGKLTQHMIDNATLHLSDSERADLNALRATDPEAWRVKITEAETQAKELLRKKVKDFEQEGIQFTELEIRQNKVADFKAETGVELSDEFIEENLPAKYTKDLAEGKINFDQFLQRSKDYLTKAKVIKGSTDEVDEGKPDLSKAGGASKPTKQATDADDAKSYSKETY